ncbi:MAG: hypothetical protein ACREAC_08885, partial [Blastocatellia bacterium]
DLPLFSARVHDTTSRALMRCVVHERKPPLQLDFEEVEKAQRTAFQKARFVFRTKRGGPLSQTNVLRRYVHPIVAGGETTPGVTGRKAGFHIFRRFRTSWLRKSPWEENLITLWDGHAGRAGRIIIQSNCERMFNSGSSEHRRSG